MIRTTKVRSGDVELAVFEAGERGRTPLLFAHGFPDCHGVHSKLMDALKDEFHVVSFDMRGVGESTPPASRRGYRVDAILPDFTAVIDATFGPDAKVHLFGHDWGSCLGFSYVADPEGATRIRSFTSLSGPHVGLMWSTALRLARSGGPGAALAALRQLAASWYVFAFQLPYLPERAFRRGGTEAYRRALIGGGVPVDDPYLDVTVEEIVARTEHALNLYRMNATRPPPAPAPGAINVPLLVVIPERDPFIRPEVHTYLGEIASDVTYRRYDASHWMLRSHPEELATELRTFVKGVDAR
jgi:pimeloyl-ACP methyl ester carboxylesterase